MRKAEKGEGECFRITWKRDPYHMLKNESDELTRIKGGNFGRRLRVEREI